MDTKTLKPPQAPMPEEATERNITNIKDNQNPLREIELEIARLLLESAMELLERQKGLSVNGATEPARTQVLKQ